MMLASQPFGVPLALLLLLTAPSVAAADWPMYRYDETHQGFDSGNAEFGVFKSSPSTPDGRWWSQAVGATIQSPPVVANGKLFIGAASGVLYAYDAVSGSPLWNFTLPGSKISGAPAVAGNRVFFVTEAGALYALNAENGQTAFSQPYTVGPTFSSPVIHEFKIFIGNNAGEVHSVDAQTLQQRWVWRETCLWSATNASQTACDATHVGNRPIEGTPAVFGSKVYFGAWNNEFYAISEDAATRGSQNVAVTHWWYRAGAEIKGSPAIDATNQRVVFGTNDGHLIALGLNSGAAAWDKTDLEGANPTQILSSPAIAYGKVFYGANNRKVIARTLTDGGLAWNFTAAGQVHSSPAVANNHVFVGDQGRKLHMLDAANGQEKWSFTAADAFKSSPAIVGGQGFAASADGTIYSFGQDRPPAPDLKVEDLTVDDAVSGVTTTIRSTITNVGNEAAPTTTAKVFVAGVLQGEVIVPALDPAKSYRLESSWRPAAVGSIVLKVWADANNVIKEFDEGNNQRVMSVNVREAPTSEDAATSSEEGAPGFGPLAFLLALGLAVAAATRRARNG